MEINKRFVNEFYKMFVEAEEGIFAGSKEQMRMILQLKLNVFIPSKCIDIALKNFISSGLLIDTGRTKEISRTIGKKHFKNTAQKVYMLNEENKDNKLLINSMYVVCSGVNKSFSELTKQKDIDKLRNLEEKKGVKVHNLIKRYSYSLIEKVTSDINLLYQVPRHEVLGYIELLNKYDEVEAKRQADIKSKVRELKENKIQKKWKEVLYQLMVLMQNIISVEDSLILILKTEFPCAIPEEKIGIIKIKDVLIEDSILTLRNIDVLLNIKITGIATNLDTKTVVLKSELIKLEFKVPKQSEEYFIELNYEINEEL